MKVYTVRVLDTVFRPALPSSRQTTAHPQQAVEHHLPYRRQRGDSGQDTGLENNHNLIEYGL